MPRLRPSQAVRGTAIAVVNSPAGSSKLSQPVQIGHGLGGDPCWRPLIVWQLALVWPGARRMVAAQPPVGLSCCCMRLAGRGEHASATAHQCLASESLVLFQISVIITRMHRKGLTLWTSSKPWLSVISAPLRDTSRGRVIPLNGPHAVGGP